MKLKLLYSFFTLTLVATLGFLFFNQENPYKYQYQIVNKKQEQNELSQTIGFYEKRLERNPTGYQDMGILAGLYLESAKTSGVEDFFKNAENLALDSIKEMPIYNLQSRLVLADLYQSRHQFNDAIDMANIILKQKAHYPPALSILVKCNLALGNIIEGQRIADELLVVTSDQGAFVLKATLLGLQNRNKEAIWNFEHALALDDSENPEGASYTRVIYARFMSGVDKINEARLLLKESLRIDPQSFLALDQLGELYEKEHSYKEAINFYKDAYKISNQLLFLFKEARVRLLNGEKVLGTGLLGQTEVLVRSELTNKKTYHLNELTKILLLKGSKQDNAEALSLAQRESTMRRNPETLTLLAESYLRNNKPIEAKKIISELLSKNIYNKEILSLASNIEMNLKNNSLAEVYKNY
jgi:tetratricopeptide (TPR) repeat protein